VARNEEIKIWSPYLPQGSVLAPVLFNLCTNDLPVTHSCKFIYADDVNLAAQCQYFSKPECSLSADLVRMSHYCRQWRLKPSAPKTVSSCFHLHNASASRELSVWLNGQLIKYDHQPTFLGVTLDRTLSFKPHLNKTAAKLKNRNNLLTKLAGSSWVADADTLRTSALALCYSVGEYCAPLWCRLAHTGLVDAQLNSTMHLISGTLHPTALPWLAVAKARAHESWPLHHDISNPPPFRLTSRKPLWRESEPVDINSQWRESWKSLGGQCTPHGRPHNPTTGLCSSSTTMVSPEPFPHRTRSLRCL